MAYGYSVTQAVALAMNTAITTARDAGTAAVLEIYSGTVPSNADASAAGLTLLASLTLSASSVSGYSDTGSASRATFNSITSDSSADATGTASCWRIKTQTGGTVTEQGTCGTSGSFDILFNSVSFTAGDVIAISAATVDVPEGP